MRFYLGTHHPGWLARLDVPLFVSHRRLATRKTLPVARGRWALDSGGFTEIGKYGRWVTSTSEYVDAVERYATDIGGLDWAAPRDWMCEPWIIDRTGLTVEHHQRLTVESVCELRRAAPHLPWIPVLQGWTRDDYGRCIEMYDDVGVDLAAEPLVGVGSVCRRQATGEIAGLLVWLHAQGLRLHGFGVKTSGLNRYGWALSSADSMAWSYGARRSPPLPGCSHTSCANCAVYALRWRRRVLARLDVQQLALPI